MNWNTVIIDDEPLARQRLRRLLEPYDEVKVVGEAGNGPDGIGMIEALKPDLVFLDVEMPGMNGFDMLAKISHPIKVVFTTAYDHYAIKAFEEDSVDYLLKPIEQERLEKTVQRLQQNLPVPPLQMPLMPVPQRAIKSLTVKTGDKVILVRLSDIISIEASIKFVFLTTMDGKKHLTDYTIKDLEQRLPEQFTRISRGLIVNGDHIKEIRRGFHGARVFAMNNGSRLVSSRSYGETIHRKFGI